MIVAVQYYTFFSSKKPVYFLGLFEDETDLQKFACAYFEHIAGEVEVWFAQARAGLRIPDLQDVDYNAFSEEEAATKEWHKLRVVDVPEWCLPDYS